MLFNESPVVVFENDCIVDRVCPKCFRFIKADTIVCEVNGLDQTRVRAECGKCGPVEPEWGYL